MRRTRQFRRGHIYTACWITVTSAALLLRFTVFRGTSSDDRWALTITYLLVTWIQMVITSGVEQRRLALVAGWRGRGTMGVLRGWVKTAYIELLLDDRDEKMSPRLREAIVEFSRFRRLMPLFFCGSWIVALTLLFF